MQIKARQTLGVPNFFFKKQQINTRVTIFCLTLTVKSTTITPITTIHIDYVRNILQFVTCHGGAAAAGFGLGILL